MSRRKQQAIAAAAQVAQELADKQSRSWFGRLISNRRALTITGIIAAALLAIVGVSAANYPAGENGERSLLGSWFSSSAPAPAAMPTPTPSPQLSKEYVYAGGRMLAVEDANASSSNNQPADLVVWRLSTGYWYIKDSTDGTWTSGAFGLSTDTAAPGDFDGDGLADFSVFRKDTPSAGLATWYTQSQSQLTAGTFSSIQFGLNADTPVPADYDGDGRADIAVWRSGTTAQFIILNSSTSTAVFVNCGQTSDKPMPADYDGDGRADPAVYRSSNLSWIINRSSDNQIVTQAFGLSTDLPVTGDYDGDGKFDLAVRRNSSNSWLYKQAATGGTTTTLTFTGGFTMLSTDKEVPGDYDGDGKTDIAVWRSSTGEVVSKVVEREK